MKIFLSVDEFLVCCDVSFVMVYSQKIGCARPCMFGVHIQEIRGALPGSAECTLLSSTILMYEKHKLSPHNIARYRIFLYFCTCICPMWL